MCALLCACGDPASSSEQPASSSAGGATGGSTTEVSSGGRAGARLASAGEGGGLDTSPGVAGAGAAPTVAGAAGENPSAGAGTGGGGGAVLASAGASSGGLGGVGGATSAHGGGGGAAPFGVCTGTPTKAVTIYMIGDSTMSVYASDLYPRMGWGQPLGGSFEAKCATVVDKALSGRSSKSFYDEGAWTPVKNALEPGDYVLIQFGHNDEKSDEPTLYTNPQTTYKQYLTTYVNDTRAKSATPLLLTSINRNAWNGSSLSDSHGAYPPAVRELAASLKVELIDLTALTKAYFEKLGQVETSKLFLILTAGQFPNYPNGVTDNTHLQEKGALKIGQLALANAYAQKLTVASYLKAVPVTP